MKPGIWSRTPPTKADIKKSYNGYFWIKFTIDPGEEGFPPIEMVEPIQIFYEFDPKKKGLARIDGRLCCTFGTKNVYLDDKKTMKGIKWQFIPEPEPFSEV